MRISPLSAPKCLQKSNFFVPRENDFRVRLGYVAHMEKNPKKKIQTLTLATAHRHPPRRRRRCRRAPPSSSSVAVRLSADRRQLAHKPVTSPKLTAPPRRHRQPLDPAGGRGARPPDPGGRGSPPLLAATCQPPSPHAARERR